MPNYLLWHQHEEV
jgi:hypothetical protein